EVDINNSPMFSAVKEWDCSVSIHLAAIEAPGLFERLVHEALHGVSVGVTYAAFRSFRGYEEGVVEKLTRLFGPRIAEIMQISASFEARDAFESHLACLERLRAVANMEEESFYVGLLRMPLADREQAVVKWTIGANEEEPAVRVLARISTLLRSLR